MYKRLILSLSTALALLFTVSPALAQTFGLDATAQKAQYTETNIYSIISTGVSMLLGMAGLIFLVIMFYAGLRWMTARGDEERITKAKNAVFAAIIGFILVTASYGIATFVFSKLVK